MDLSNPLAVVTPTLDAAVLQALAATTGWATGAHVQSNGRKRQRRRGAACPGPPS
jgi:hypothetical protein